MDLAWVYRGVHLDKSEGGIGDGDSLTFNQGVVGSIPTRLIKPRNPTDFQDLPANQGVTTLGLPTP